MGRIVRVTKIRSGGGVGDGQRFDHQWEVNSCCDNVLILTGRSDFIISIKRLLLTSKFFFRFCQI